MRYQTQLLLSRTRCQLALLRCSTSAHAPASSGATDAILGTRTVNLTLPSLRNSLSSAFSSQTPSYLSAAAPDADQQNRLQLIVNHQGSADSLHRIGEQSRRFATTASPQASTSAAPAVPDWADTLDRGTSRKQRYPQPQNPSKDPWTPTQQLGKRKFLPRRMGFLLQVLEKEQEEAAMRQKKIPDFHAGDVLELKLAVPENKGRPATFRGVCIARRNRGIRTSFTLRNHMGAVGAVERTFPLFSPTIQAVTVLERRRVRRAKLFYLRDRNPKEYRVG